jgi:uroporphyrinogen-III synthase
MTEHKYYSVICYETVPNDVDKQVVATLDDKDYILFTAPSAVRTYYEKFGLPKSRSIAIGPTTASAMTERGWTEFATMKQPDVDRVLEYL